MYALTIEITLATVKTMMLREGVMEEKYFDADPFIGGFHSRLIDELTWVGA